MNKKISVGIATALILIAVTITFTATIIFSMNKFDAKVIASAQKRDALYDQMIELDKIVQQYYYKNVDDAVLNSEILDGYVRGLGDPNSVYLTADEKTQREIQSKGTIISLGIEVTKDASGYMYINNVYANSPADKIGLLVGDVITQIGDTNVLSVGFDEAKKLIYGIEATSVKVVFLRNDGEGKTEENTANLSYASIEATSVNAVRRDNIYYIRVSAIWDTTPAQFGRAIREGESLYAEDTIKGFILDLRDVQGGYNKDYIREMLQNLMPTGALYSGIYRDGSTKLLDSSSNENPNNIPIVVLVNKNTVGYAELLAAVLGDRANVRVVGKTTAGVGTYNVLYPLTDGSAIYLSVAVLRTAGGTVFHETGLVPDFEVDAPENFILLPEPEAEQDPQFSKAIEVLNSIQ